MKKKVLFICIHNSGRSQMAAAYLDLLGRDYFEVESAGFDPTEINPLVIEVMKEEGIDLSGRKAKDVFDLVRAGRFFGFVITVCSRAKEKDCPVFPGITQRLSWDLEDPEGFEGTYEERLEKVRQLRNKIKAHVESFIAAYK